MKRIYFIADIGANHDGSLERAFDLIDLAKKAGADAAKFQNYTAAGLISQKGFEKLKIGHQANWKKSVYDVYNDAAINPDWTQALARKCKEVGIDYFTSAYSKEEVDLVDPYVGIYKIGSGDITYTELIEYTAKKGKPIILSTGASSAEDVSRAMAILSKYCKSITLLQCNTNYTGSDSNYNYINLNVIKTYAVNYPFARIGLSDHTLDDTTVLGAVALGALVIEKHFTDDRTREGNDHSFAIEPKEWALMVKRAHDLYDALGDGIKKIEKNEQETAFVQRRGLRYKNSLKKGQIIAREDIMVLRPADGLPAYVLNDFIGKELLRNVNTDDILVYSDIEAKRKKVKK